jgi:alkylhydroperoxidase family enzyme
MARLPYIDEADMAPSGEVSGPVLNITRALANSPGAAKHSLATAMYIRHRSPLDPRLRELAILQVGYCVKNRYEYAHHLKIALGCGVPEGDIRAIGDETSGRTGRIDPLASTVLRAAREMTLDAALSEEIFSALHEELKTEHLVDLLFTIANYNSVVRILASLEVDLEEGYESYLDRFPLPPDEQSPLRRDLHCR